MPTTNPVPSSDPSDLVFNAEKLDQLINSTAPTFTDRLGVQRMTASAALAEIAADVAAVDAAKNTAVNVSIPADVAAVDAAKNTAVNVSIPAAVALVDTEVAQTAAGAATAAKVVAEAARDAALIQAGVYPDEATGRAAVADGQAFKVQGSGDVAAFEYRRTNSTTSALIAIYPSSAKVNGILTQIEDAGVRMYTGAGPRYPLAVDSDGKMLLWFNSVANRVEGDGLRGVEPVYSAAYTGAGPVYPILTDANLKVLLGYDATTQEIVGALPVVPKGSPSAPVALTDPPIPKAVNHLLFYGQSLSVGAQGVPIISTTQPYSNMTFNGGPRAAAADFSAFKPLIEDALAAPDGGSNRGETPCSGAANYATTLAALSGMPTSAHVILASAGGYGGAAISTLVKGTTRYNTYFKPHITNGKALNTDYALHAFGWLQGENDAVTGTQTPYATYRAALQTLQSDVEFDAKAISGQTSPVYCLTYQLSYAAATWPDIALAQLDLAQKNAKFALVTPMYHMPYAGDNVHLTAVGYKWVGAYFGRAYKQLAIDGVKPQWLNPLSATRRGAVIRVRFSVPQLPLVLDTISLAATANYGFRVLDGASTAAIESIAVSGADVVITLSAVPSGAVTVRYALDHLGAGLTFTGGASGNLRDSTSDYITINAVDRPLYHVCPHFQITATLLQE